MPAVVSRFILLFIFALSGCGQFPVVLDKGGIERARVPPNAAAAARDARIGNVLAQTAATWDREFRERNCCYVPATAIIYAGQIVSPCKLLTAVDGPTFCNADRRIYLNDTYWRDLAWAMGRQSDMAEAVAVAHEVGHVVQDQSGRYDRTMAAIARLPPLDGARLNARLEQQADCYAGIWLHDQRAQYSSTQVAEAIRSRFIMGDDYRQRQVRGYHDPDEISHGLSVERVAAFTRGLDSGDPDACEIFGD